MKLNPESIKAWAGKKNLIPKLVSIILAVILWGYLTSSESGDVKFKLPLTYKNLDQALAVSRLSNKYIMVRITGRKDDLKNVNSKNLKVYIDLSSARIGEFNSFRIKVEKTDLPEGLDVSVNPEEVKLFVEKKVFRNIMIKPRYSGDPDKGFILGKIKVKPEYVRIAGSASLIANIDVINTEYIFLNNRNVTFQTPVKLEKINEDEIDYSISEADVTVPLISAADIASIELPVSVKNRIKGFVYDTAVDRVNVSVVLPRNRSIESLNLVAFIDASEIPVMSNDAAVAGSYEKEAVVHVRNGALEDDDVLSVNPEMIKVFIKRE